jgi:hypothetical protein
LNLVTPINVGKTGDFFSSRRHYRVHEKIRLKLLGGYL